MHGAGEPHRGYVAYHQQNGSSYCGGVTVSWNLADAGPGDGGFACVSGSHKSQFPRPVGVRTADEDMGLIEQPIVGAGDVLFFMDGAGRTATRTGRSAELAPPEIYWGEDLVAGMSPQERAVMYGPASAPGTNEVVLTLDADGVVRVNGQA